MEYETPRVEITELVTECNILTGSGNIGDITGSDEEWGSVPSQTNLGW